MEAAPQRVMPSLVIGQHQMEKAMPLQEKAMPLPEVPRACADTQEELGSVVRQQHAQMMQRLGDLLATSQGILEHVLRMEDSRRSPLQEDPPGFPLRPANGLFPAKHEDRQMRGREPPSPRTKPVVQVESEWETESSVAAFSRPASRRPSTHRRPSGLSDMVNLHELGDSGASDESPSSRPGSRRPSVTCKPSRPSVNSAGSLQTCGSLGEQFSETTSGLARPFSMRGLFRRSFSKGETRLPQPKRNYATASLTMPERWNMNADGLDESRLQTFAKAVVISGKFEGFFAVLIVLNSMFIGLEVELEATGTIDSPHVIYGIGLAFSAGFIVELALRLIAHRSNFFLENRMWNTFDIFLVTLSCFEVILDTAFPVDDNDVASSNLSNVRLLRMLRITRLMRLLRLLRLARLLRFLRALRLLVCSIGTTMKSLVWVCLLIVMNLYLFSTVFTQASSEFLTDQECAQGQCRNPTEVQEMLFHFWGTLPRSMLTLFQCITGGIDWDHAIRPLGDVHPMWTVLFLAYVSFSIFAMLNVVTGVFCQGAIESAQHDRDMMVQQMLLNKELFVEKLRAQFATMFESIDQSSAGEITLEMFSTHISDSTVQAYFALLDLEPSDAWTLFKLLEGDCTQPVDAEEFVNGCLRFKGSARSIDLAKLRYENRWMLRSVATLVERIESQLTGLQVSTANTVAQAITSIGTTGGRGTSPTEGRKGGNQAKLIARYQNGNYPLIPTVEPKSIYRSPESHETQPGPSVSAHMPLAQVRGVSRAAEEDKCPPPAPDRLVHRAHGQDQLILTCLTASPSLQPDVSMVENGPTPKQPDFHVTGEKFDGMAAATVLDAPISRPASRPASPEPNSPKFQR